MRRLTHSLALVTLALVASCSDSVGPTRPRSELQANRDKWQSRGYSEYTYTLTRVCFCAEVGPYTIDVAGKTVRSAVVVQTNKPAIASNLPTIDGLFDFIERGLDEGAARMEVTYDAQLGYPTQIVYDGKEAIADDELFITAANVMPKALSNGRP